jgi:hypothetical protein
MLAMTSFSVVIASAVLIRFGMTVMAWRLLLSGIIGYIVFLFLLRVWIWLCRERHEKFLGGDGSFVDAADVGDTAQGLLNLNMPSISDTGAEGFSFGGGGDFAGGGAGGDFDAPNVSMPAVAFSSAGSPPSSGGLGVSDAVGDIGSGIGIGDVDLDDGLALLLIVLIAMIVFGALIYVIFIAPTLFAELLIDSAVVGGLYKHVDSAERTYWLKTALRKTAIPAVIVLVLLAAAGAIMQAAVPEAITTGDFLRAVL